MRFSFRSQNMTLITQKRLILLLGLVYSIALFCLFTQSKFKPLIKPYIFEDLECVLRKTNESTTAMSRAKGSNSAPKMSVDDVEENAMFYNSIPKTGSLGLSYSFQELSRENQFTLLDPPILQNGRATLEEQQRLAAELFCSAGSVA
ncbi:unnamed protein product [Notodromas monacha]|uniref:Uncharacterized protein n=1 Tax=Notodromas monacha TaxID=399045 RepID=A0A7R9C0F6_9CRUS|nr:unnamed protein product [Notodromas monacha]CAG0923899.1 unnamed protein product [Notodromas monacha]